MRHAGPARRDLGVRTAFNLLGPLTNPAGATRQLVGVPRPEFTELLARALLLLGSDRAWVVHGADGIDEISTTGYTKVSECRNGAVNTFYLHPTDVGLPKALPDALKGGDANENAAIVERILAGGRGPARDIVLLNAGASLFIAGVAASIVEGIARAARAIDGGEAKRTLERMITLSKAEEIAAASVMGAPAATADLLATIVAATRRIVEVREQREALAALAARAERRTATPGRFRAALVGTSAGGTPVGDGLQPVPGDDVPRIIAECKRRSPSRGVLRPQYDPVDIAIGYQQAGAAAISVLTEPTFFDGALDHLQAVRDAVSVPVLRKDFIVSEYQLFEARAAGADAVLLIVAALDAQTLAVLHARASALGLDVLVEVHGADELSAALDAGAQIIGVNNRNLRTLAVDVTASETLAARMPRGIVRVSESGLKTAADLLRLRRLGYDAFLIGERFMTEPDPGVALTALLQRCFTTEDTKDTKVKT